jgi:putative transposase
VSAQPTSPAGDRRDPRRRGPRPRPGCQAKWPKAVAKIVDDTEVLLSFFDFPAEHCPLEDHQPHRVHLRHRAAKDQSDQGPGSKAAGLAIAYKLIEAAQDRSRAVNAPHLAALVRAAAKFDKGG